MNSDTLHQDKTIATLIHLSVFTKYFIPFGNFIIPMVLWLTRKEKDFVDQHGRNAINFQISLFLYIILLVCLGIAGIIFLGAKLSLERPFIISEEQVHLENFSQAMPFLILVSTFGVLILGLFILEVYAVISASLKASEGKLYKYPLTINFISPAATGNHQSNHQSENEQFNNTQNQTL
ncbi:DUF4870 domain-containing protein [Salegentibacter chungangensis]|uniref:DUF4870 domain-containing protein n=1 Tax=Salegentibacter chungangensis TaxID=1335724 RepID=A0ABW3NT82_9FLAO